MLDYCRGQGIVIQAYSPLTQATRLDNERLRSVAARHDRTPAQVLLAWSIQRGAVPLPKANQRDHLVENLQALEFELGTDDLDVLNSLNEQYSSFGALPYV